MTLLLNQIFTNTKSGIVKLDLPTGTTVTGLLVNDPSIKVRNQWGTIMPESEDLNQLLMMAGRQNLFSWVSASSAAWKSTDPLTLGLDFYLLSYDKNSNVKGQASALLSLAALGDVEGSSFAEATQVQVHGGYKIDLFDSNSKLTKSTIDSYLQEAAGKLAGDKAGTITIRIGDQIKLKNMLLDECTAEHSRVQVASGVPLFIKITATFRLCRAPLTADIEGIYS